MHQPIASLLDLSGRQILVTGASGTLGHSIALRLAQAGARVVAQYHTNHPDALMEAAAADSSLRIKPVQGALDDVAGVDQLLTELRGLKMEIDGLVNNAADQSLAAYAQMNQQQWRQMMSTNLDAPFHLTQQLAGQMHDGGSVVNISSIEGADPAPGHGHYATSKAALNMLTRSMAAEFGQAGIRVNSISPGLISRPGIEDQWPEGVERWQSRAPLSRLGQTEDVANAVLYLMSPAAAWISGANLVIDGGMSCVSRW